MVILKYVVLWLAMVSSLHLFEYLRVRAAGHFTSQSHLGVAADYMLLPVMWVLSGFAMEDPQRGHFSNNQRLSHWRRTKTGDIGLWVTDVDLSAGPAWKNGLPLVHLPLLPGGWKQYVVLRPVEPQAEWFIGWLVGDDVQVRTIPLQGSVRMLMGSHPTQFVGITREGKPIRLMQISKGTIGDGGPFRNAPLL